MVPGAPEVLYRAQESYGARLVSGFADATGGAGRRNATVAMLTRSDSGFGGHCLRRLTYLVFAIRL